jgi:hypothetical protein
MKDAENGSDSNALGVGLSNQTLQISRIFCREKFLARYGASTRVHIDVRTSLCGGLFDAPFNTYLHSITSVRGKSIEEL